MKGPRFGMKRIFAASLFIALSLSLSLQAGEGIRVIDGDTVEINGETIRLASIDAPETLHAQCDAEKQLGNAATAMLRKLLSKGRVTVARGDPQSGRMIDKYGRTLGTVYIDGHDAGALLIGAGLARPWTGKRQPWCTP